MKKMEHTSVKNEFGDQVEEKPIIIVPESSRQENNIFDEHLESTTYHQGSGFYNNKNAPAVDTTDDIKRWTVSSSVILPIDETEDVFNISPADKSTGRVLLVDPLKNEHTDTSDAWELNEHTVQVPKIPNLSMNPPELTTDSDVLISPWSTNERFVNSLTGDSQVKTFNEPTSINDGKFTLQVGNALCRDMKAMDDTPEKMKGNSFFSKSFVETVTLSSSGQTQRKMSEFSNVNQQSHSQSGGTLSKCHVSENTFPPAGSFNVHNGIDTGEKPYKCDVGNKTFRQIDRLTRHQRTHTGEKPYKCDVCNKKFTGPSNLRTHQRIHTGEKPYKCDVCNKTFTGPSNLHTHQRIHTGEKPYKCDVCDQDFTTSSNLTRHQRIHMRYKPF